MKDNCILTSTLNSICHGCLFVEMEEEKLGKVFFLANTYLGKKRSHRSLKRSQGSWKTADPLVWIINSGIRPFVFKIWLCHLIDVWFGLLTLWVTSSTKQRYLSHRVAYEFKLTFIKCLEKSHDTYKCYMSNGKK